MDEMNGFGYLVLIGWIPVVMYLFSRLPVQRALILSFLIAWLFLPEASIPVAGLPDLTKMSLTCYGILFATAIFDIQRFRQCVPHWIDLPMVLWCLCPIASSLTNGLGIYDGLSASLSQVVTWGFPYFLGRLYLNTLKGLQQLAIAIIWGGLLYIPLCLLEVRLSPQLHRWFYGFHAQSFVQAIRYGGFRPSVFMQHGLMVGIWMMTATLLAFWFWRIGTLQPLLAQFAFGGPPYGQGSIDARWSYLEKLWVSGPPLLIFLFLLITFVLIKSTGAYFLLFLGIGLLAILRWWKNSLPLFLIILAICGYLGFAAAGGITPQLIEQVSITANRFTTTERAGSLVFRLENEAKLSAKARQQPWFGWGGWGRSRIFDDYGKDISVTDSLWIINFGNFGLVGVFSWLGAMLLPLVGFVLLRYPVETWLHPQVLPAGILAVGLMLYVIDCLVNGMVNPIYTLIAGALAGIVARRPVVPKRPSAVSSSVKRNAAAPAKLRRQPLL